MFAQSEAFVQTVTGATAPSSLGHTQCHEHIYLRKGPSFASNAALCMEDYGRSLAELKEYAACGGGTIVDAQPGGFGRDADILRRLSVESGVKIIAVTGFHKLLFLEENALISLDEDALAGRFFSEITEGMLSPGGERTEAKAGLVKAAFEPGGLEHPTYRRLFSAVAAAAGRSGAPVMIHTEKDTDMLALIRWFSAHHLPAERLLICHLDRTHYDPQYHLQVLATGCSLCYDSVHRLKYVSDAQELSLISQMCAAGYAGQIVLSLDTTNQRLRAYFATDMGLNYLLTDFRPMLEQAGIAPGHIHAMMQDNAERVLQIVQ